MALLGLDVLALIALAVACVAAAATIGLTFDWCHEVNITAIATAAITGTIMIVGYVIVVKVLEWILYGM